MKFARTAKYYTDLVSTYLQFYESDPERAPLLNTPDSPQVQQYWYARLCYHAVNAPTIRSFKFTTEALYVTLLDGTTESFYWRDFRGNNPPLKSWPGPSCIVPQYSSIPLESSDHLGRHYLAGC